ncbi:MAG: 4-(cytidine 5'-diphospho)-2-C-methyl-D-erythritol kinase [Treponema sp.]|nr:4-(cytidine 5'-diphospho)-2-C-methyl-D-erythritol kinase [Treponema sp.]
MGKKGPGAFHDLESIFTLVEFGDTLECGAGGTGQAETGLRIIPRGPFAGLFSRRDRAFLPGSPENNLVYRASELFRSAVSFKKKLDITLIKRVPPGSGLGGGSSDAAATLLALNFLAGGPLSFDGLLRLGEKLGSDVPFFLYALRPPSGGGAACGSPAAWVSGRGERVVPIKAPAPLPVLLVFPGFSSNTGEAFTLLDEFRSGPSPVPSPAKEVLIAALDEDPRRWPYSNDFLELFLKTGKHADRYGSILEGLRSSGAVFAGLSGSGSACFGVFPAGTDMKKTLIPKAEGIIYLQNTFFLAS